MKQLFDLFPAAVFFAAFYLTGKNIIQATAATMVASALQVTLGWLVWRRVDRMHLAVFAVLVLFGGLTIALHNETFIKWKPSIVDAIIVVTLLASEFTPGRNLVQVGAEAALARLGDGTRVEAPPGAWRLVNFATVAFFACSGLLNLYVAYHYSTETWLVMKTFGFPTLNGIFMLAVIARMWRYLVRPEATASTGGPVAGNERQPPRGDD